MYQRTMCVIWQDKTITTSHDFADASDLEAWLSDVLGSLDIDDATLEECGLPRSGLGLLAYYRDEGLDDLGLFTLLLDGIEADPKYLTDGPRSEP